VNICPCDRPQTPKPLTTPLRPNCVRHSPRKRPSWGQLPMRHVEKPRSKKHLLKAGPVICEWLRYYEIMCGGVVWYYPVPSGSCSLVNVGSVFVVAPAFLFFIFEIGCIQCSLLRVYQRMPRGCVLSAAAKAWCVGLSTGWKLGQWLASCSGIMRLGAFNAVCCASTSACLEAVCSVPLLRHGV